MLVAWSPLGPVVMSKETFWFSFRLLKPEPWIAELPADQQASALLYTLCPEQIEHVFIAGRRVGPK